MHVQTIDGIVMLLDRAMQANVELIDPFDIHFHIQ